MAALVLLAPKPLSGKTTIAAALAERIKSEGKALSITRLGDDANAAADKALFSRISGPAGAEITLAETPAGEQSLTEGRAIVVADAAVSAGEIAEFCRPLAGKLAGVILNRVPARRAQQVKADVEGAGLKVLGLVPEDRLLASPTLAEVSRALDAEQTFFDSKGDRPLDRTLIAPISADPGQGYFARTSADTVIVRSDKPDLQLAALNAGVCAMIVTGDRPLLRYVLDRAEEDMVPLLRTKLETPDAVKVIEELYASKPFAGGPEKLTRAGELLGEIDLAGILS
jgi:BioD-like phosphotransacetylase family protein